MNPSNVNTQANSPNGMKTSNTKKEIQKDSERKEILYIVFESIDNIVQTLYNEPSLGLYYSQQHIHNNFPNLLFQMDRMHENRKKLDNYLLDMQGTSKELEELSSLTGDFSFKMLTLINSINFEVSKKDQ